MPNVLFFKVTLFFYFLGTFFSLLNLWDRKGERNALGLASWGQKIALGLTGAGFLFHTFALGARMQEAGYFMLTNLHEAISFFSWAIVLIFLWVEWRHRVYVLGSFILPLAFLSLLSAAALPNEIGTLDPSLKSAWLGVHTTLSLLGIAAFAIAFIAGIMYLLQESFLKSKQFSPLYHKLPSLDLLDKWNQRAIFWGFPLLTLGIITGAYGAQYVWGSYWKWDDPKQTLALGTWFFYLVVLHGRVTIGWRAKKAAYLAIIGFIGVIFIFVGVNFFGRGSHSFL